MANETDYPIINNIKCMRVVNNVAIMFFHPETRELHSEVGPALIYYDTSKSIGQRLLDIHNDVPIHVYYYLNGIEFETKDEYEKALLNLNKTSLWISIQRYYTRWFQWFSGKKTQ